MGWVFSYIFTCMCFTPKTYYTRCNCINGKELRGICLTFAPSLMLGSKHLCVLCSLELNPLNTPYNKKLVSSTSWKVIEFFNPYNMRRIPIVFATTIVHTALLIIVHYREIILSSLQSEDIVNYVFTLQTLCLGSFYKVNLY